MSGARSNTTTTPMPWIYPAGSPIPPWARLRRFRIMPTNTISCEMSATSISAVGSTVRRSARGADRTRNGRYRSGVNLLEKQTTAPFPRSSRAVSAPSRSVAVIDPMRSGSDGPQDRIRDSLRWVWLAPVSAAAQWFYRAGHAQAGGAPCASEARRPGTRHGPKEQQCGAVRDIGVRAGDGRPSPAPVQPAKQAATPAARSCSPPATDIPRMHR